MSHEINLEKYELRTDLVDEVIENKKINTIKTDIEEIDNIKVQNIYLDKENSKLINKKIGNYTTIILLAISLFTILGTGIVFIKKKIIG